MRKIREVFRLKFDCDISSRQIAKSCNIARSTVGEYLFRFKQAGLSWPLPVDIDDGQLEQLLYPQLPAVPRTSALSLTGPIFTNSCATKVSR